MLFLLCLLLLLKTSELNYFHKQKIEEILHSRKTYKNNFSTFWPCLLFLMVIQSVNPTNKLKYKLENHTAYGFL